MKKLMMLLLTLVMVLSFAACGSKSAEAEFFEDGEDGELKAAKAMEGMWVDIEGTPVYNVHEDGRYDLMDREGIQEKISICDGVSTVDGCEYMVVGGNEYLFTDQYGYPELYVRQEDYEKLIETVEMTPDNWNDYFEFQALRTDHLDESGNVAYNEFLGAYVLKEERTPGYIKGDVTCQYSCNSAHFAVQNPGTDQCAMGEKLDGDENNVFREAASVMDCRVYDDNIVSASYPNERNEYLGKVCAILRGSTGLNKESTEVYFQENYQVLDAHGKMHLLKAAACTDLIAAQSQE